MSRLTRQRSGNFIARETSTPPYRANAGIKGLRVALDLTDANK